ncbi:uncharacterized protein LOC111691270 isoform X2 [Anoplophora glabripennis]|uniref:uncharacterized protein LOC111691270 isoform X2 n=1 Tax=Anoplophora glabripennis TaxID=217634 RepID=UPI0008750871|nr:uncharacterized protein LOC111691270 isoform X2 [Anoplophora glabripennis]
MVNYVLSFCKITGASKIFTRNFYLPLLKPLTPREALRTLRITGKWLLGAKRQHYIPVLLNHEQKKPNNAADYGKQEHDIMEDYTYMTPVLDPENETHRILIDILESKDKKGVFVYTVEDRKYNIVLQAQFELAIRDGDIRDVLVSQKNDKIIMKLKDFKKVPMEIQYFEGTDELTCGEGATSPEEEKFHHHGKYTMSLAKIFEEKEMREEKWEEELKKMMKRRKKRKWENSKAYKEMMKRNLKNLNWKKFEEDAKKVIEEIEHPASEIPIEMEVDDLDATKNVNETILRRGPEMLNQLPTLTEIPDIIKNLGSASLHAIEDVADDEMEPSEQSKKRRVSGVKVTLPSGKECFVSGQMVHTEDGEVFVPGQTIRNEYGDEYAPGITINVDDKPTLINGLIMGEEERDPMFLPSQSTITSDGQLTFASVPEERPAPQPESERKLKRKNKKKQEAEQKDEETINIHDSPAIFEFVIIDDNFAFDDFSESEEKSTDASSVELNNSELEELDIEAIRLKQEQQRLELEKLKLILLDDGMDDIIASLEDKKAELNKKLEELRKLNINSENSLVTYVNESDALEMAARITEDKDTIIRISDILLTMTRRAATFRDKNNVRTDNINNSLANAAGSESERKLNASSNKLQVLFKTALVAANEVFKNRPKDQMMALNAIGDIMIDALKVNSKLLQELIDLMQTQFERTEVCDVAFKQLTQVVEDTKIGMLTMIANKNLSNSELQDCITKMLGSENIINVSFSKLIKVKPEIIKILKENTNCQLKYAKTEEDAFDILQKCIVKSTKIWMDKAMEAKKEETKGNDLVEFVEEASSFAKALGLEQVVEDLSNSKFPLKLNCYDQATTDMLKRMALIKQLSERDYSLKTAITRIKKNPERGKSDPRIRQLVRESAALICNLSTIRNSREIPLQLMKSQNLLAIEDFLLKKAKFDHPVLITRGSTQAVIPKDAARGVLAGRVSYILIDESGVTNFKPMHMISGMQLNRNRERRIDDYLSGVRERSSDRDEARTYLQAKNNDIN